MDVLKQIDRSIVVGMSDEDLDEFICGICLGVFVDPLTTKCCGHTFCRVCIENWLSEQNTCPNDRTALELVELISAPKTIKNLLNNLKVKCNYEEEGCPQVVRIGELAQHLTVCDFRPNQLCKTCNLLRVSALSHDCIQTLITEKHQIHENYMKVFDQKESLVLLKNDQDNLITSQQKELAKLKANHQKFNKKYQLLLEENKSLVKETNINDKQISALRNELDHLTLNNQNANENYKKAVVEKEALILVKNKQDKLMAGIQKELDQLKMSNEKLDDNYKTLFAEHLSLLQSKSNECLKFEHDNKSSTFIIKEKDDIISSLKQQLHDNFKRTVKNLKSELNGCQSSLQKPEQKSCENCGLNLVPGIHHSCIVQLIREIKNIHLEQMQIMRKECMDKEKVINGLNADLKELEHLLEDYEFNYGQLERQNKRLKGQVKAPPQLNKAGSNNDLTVERNKYDNKSWIKIQNKSDEQAKVIKNYMTEIAQLNGLKVSLNEKFSRLQEQNAETSVKLQSTLFKLKLQTDMTLSIKIENDDLKFKLNLIYCNLPILVMIFSRLLFFHTG